MPVRVSQLLSLVLAGTALAVMVVQKRRHPHGREALFVTKQAALAAAGADASTEETEEKEKSNEQI